MSTNSVKLHAYDVSHGKMRQISANVFGKHIEGMYHTAICAYGNEYFYGGSGIAYCPPCGTSLGNPTEIIDLGDTDIEQEKFHEYLQELADTKFRIAAYKIVDHNCNTFSVEVAKFLTGRKLPDKIANLNSEVSNSPLGKAAAPLLSRMQSTPQHSGTFIKGRNDK